MLTSMHRVCGLDTSLTATGIAIITQRTNGTCIANTTTITSRGQRADTLTTRAQRITTLRNTILDTIHRPQLVVIEGPSHGSKGGSPLDRHGLWWHTITALIETETPVAVCAPTTRAKFATGTGTADKAAVAAAITRLWPTTHLSNTDEADALVLAHTAAVFLGWDVPTLQRHRDALPAITWPPQHRPDTHAVS